MRKSLLAFSVLGCFATMSMADPSVTVYGLFDMSASYVHSEGDIAGAANHDDFTMENGLENGSRFGLRGSEYLGNGMKVGFVLESGIESDTGALDAKQGGRLFGREATLSLATPYGKFFAGRMPVFGSVLGENGLFRAIDPIVANYTSAIGSGYASASLWTRVDNAIAYRTPTFNGLTGYAMYSFKMDGVKGKGEEGHSETDRYASLALRYQVNALEAVLLADTTMYGDRETGAGNDVSDGVTVTLGGNYTFDNKLKLITFVQYFDSQSLNVMARGGVARDGILVATDKKGYGFVDGWGASVGVNYPLAGGNVKFSVNYRDMDNQSEVDFTRYTVAGAYDYPLSKRTALYSLLGYSQEKVENGAIEAKPDGYQFALGVIHKF